MTYDWKHHCYMVDNFCRLAVWDFVGEDVQGTEDLWKIRDGVSFPQFSWREVAGDVGGSL